MRPSSATAEAGLFGLWTDPVVVSGLTGPALVQAMLDVEAALSAAQADVGLVPRAAAEAIALACTANDVDVEALGRDAESAGNPVVALVRDLGHRVPADARPFVHLGATSQDVYDTALALLARRCGVPLLAALGAAADTCAGLARAHRDTLMPARSLGQQALPTTFGLKAAGWLVALDGGADRLADVLGRLAVQYGGAAGTLTGLDGRGLDVAAALAGRLGLAEPVLPWHTDRRRVLELGAALAGVVATSGKIALDVVLLAQSEIAEVSPGGAPGRGGSSAMPHKRNPVDAVLLRAAAVQAPGLLATLHTAAAEQEHERAAGGWHAEWATLRSLLGLAGGAAARTAGMLAELVVHPDRMRADLDDSGGLLLAEAVAARLTPSLGRGRAHELVASCARAAGEPGRSFREVLLADAEVGRLLSDADVDAALDPAGWLGSAGALVDRALAAHDHRRAG